MSIDEAIKFERESAKNNREAEALYERDDFSWNAIVERKRAEYHEQLAEWLEELKEARKGFEENRKAGYSHGYSDGYAEAIDEFAERLKVEFPMVEDEYGATTNLILNKKIDEIAEGMRGAT